MKRQWDPILGADVERQAPQTPPWRIKKSPETKARELQMFLEVQAMYKEDFVEQERARMEQERDKEETDKLMLLID